MSYNPLANILKKNLRDLRKYIIRDYNEIEELQSSVKDTQAFINRSKLKVEGEVFNFLKKIKPNYKIIENFEDNLDNFWLTNIIDSTLNFKRANENFGIKISLFEENLIQTSLFYNPLKDDFFFYEKETGAFKNETRIRVSNIKQKDNSLICIFNNKTNLSISYESLLKKCLSENFFQSLNLVHVTLI